VINVTALLAAVGDGCAFVKGRYGGLARLDAATALDRGRTKLLGISKQANKFLSPAYLTPAPL
jgi:hypothetical protein